MSIGPGRGDLQLYQGDDFYTRVRVVDGDGQDADISAYTPRAQIRRTFAADSAMDDVVVELAASIDAPHVLLTLAAGESAKLYGRYRWDLQLTDESGYVQTVIAGAASVMPEVTR